MKDHRTWIEISRANVLHNVGELRKLVGPDRIICSAVKANAYGHGMKEIAPLILEGGADWLAVDCLEEALELRESGITAPVYIMGYILLGDLETAVREGFNFVVYNPETFEKLKEVTQKVQKPAFTHLKLETGTNRQGIPKDDLTRVLSYYKEHDLIQMIGLATHFANIEDTTNHSYAEQQFQTFESLCSMVEEAGLRPKYRHCANSAAVIIFPHTHLDFVRPGIANYGLWPSKETRVSAKEKGQNLELRPVLEWKARVAEVKSVLKGAKVSYGCTYETRRDSKLAVIPGGYYNGLKRSLSNQGYVLIRSEKAPVVGRVMMNMTVVDVTDIPEAQVEDEVVFIGWQGDKSITAEEIGDLEGTINYEVTTQINPLIERRVV